MTRRQRLLAVLPDCAKHFNIDSLMDGYFPLRFPEESAGEEEWERFIVFRSPQRLVTQACRLVAGKRTWAPTVDVYYVADPPTTGLPPPLWKEAPHAAP
jgi:hypothetical protein